MLHGEKAWKKIEKSPIHYEGQRQRFFLWLRLVVASLSTEVCVEKKPEKIVERKIGEEIEKIDSQTQTKLFCTNTNIARIFHLHKQRMHFYTISEKFSFSFFHSHFIVHKYSVKIAFICFGSWRRKHHLGVELFSSTGGFLWDGTMRHVWQI